MTHLFFVQGASVARARHVGARVVGLGVPDLAPGVCHDRARCGVLRVAHTTQLGVVVKARANGAVRNLFLVDLVAVVAIAAIGCAGGVGPGLTAAALGNGFAFFPVTHKLFVGGPLDGFEVSRLNGLGHLAV